MKRLLQLIGIRKWSGEDLVSLQSESLKTIDAFFATYGNCIFNGCEVIKAADGSYSITHGFVALQGKDQENQNTFKVVPFGGLENVVLPVFLKLAHNVIEKEYIDGKVKPVAYDYYAAASSIRPDDETQYLEITAAGGRQFVDAVGITRKLDKTGNGKDVTVTFAQAAERANVQTGEKLTAILGKIARWFADLKTVAFTGKAADLTEDSAHRLFTDAERTKLNGVEANANNYTHPATHSVDMLTESAANVVMTKPERDKLAGIEAGANAYAHPAAHPAGMITEDTSRRFVTEAEKQNWNSKAAGNHNHDAAYSLKNHNHTGTYQPVGDYSSANHNHAGVYAPATHNHTPAEVGAIPANASCNKNWEYNGQSGQPGWLWGSNDGSNMYVWSPSEFSVRYAATAGSAPASDVPAWAKAPAKPAYTAAEVGAAAASHNHSGVYQPAGNYASSSHSHTASQVTEETNKHFMTDAERTKVSSSLTTGETMKVLCAGEIGSGGNKGTSRGVFNVSKNSVGRFTISHNYNAASIVIVSGNDGFTAGISSRSALSFDVRVVNAGSDINAGFTFVMYAI